MFNSLNSDGMPLLDADIISAQLYSEAVKINRHKDFNEKWKRLLETVSRLEVANIDAILMQYMYIRRAQEKEYISDTGSVNVTTPGLRRYYIDINKKILKDPLALSDELLKIAEIWMKIKEYPIVKLLLKFNENIKLYLSGYLSRYAVNEVTEEEVKGICECLIRLFTVMELVDIGYSSSKFKTFLFGEMTKLVFSDITIDEIENDFFSHIAGGWNTDEIEEKIKEYEKNVLVFLNEYLFSKEKEIPFVITGKYDIEHIMPASGKNLSQIRLDAGISDEDEFSGVVNKLGNKILLEEDINRSIGNEWFRTKVQTSVISKSGYKDSQYNIATSMVEKYKEIDKPSWGKSDINSITTKIAKRILRFIFSK